MPSCKLVSSVQEKENGNRYIYLQDRVRTVTCSNLTKILDFVQVPV